MAHLVGQWSYYKRFDPERLLKLREALTRAFRRAVSKSMLKTSVEFPWVEVHLTRN